MKRRIGDAADSLVQTLFIESSCDDERIIEQNVRRVKISSPDVSVLLELSLPGHVER